MESQNLSTAQNINLALYYKSIDHDIFNDYRYISLMEILIKDNNFVKYNYAFYTDSYLLKNNIFIPVFHTMYLASGSKRVVISNKDDVWLTEIFNNNTFYVLNNETDTEFDYESYGIEKINSIEDIL